MQRRLLPIVLLSLAAFLPCTHAKDEAHSQMIVTNRGKVYEECRIFQVDPDGVMISHKHGGAKLLFAELPEETAIRLGYHPEKAQAYEKERAENMRAKRQQMWEFRKEMARLDAQAKAAEAARLNLQAMQQEAVLMGGYGYGYGYAPGLLFPTYAQGYGDWGWQNGFHQDGWQDRRYHHHSGTTIGPVSGNIQYHGVRYPHLYRRTPSVPFGVPAMGPLTPRLAPLTSNPGSIFPSR
jgi:hypothetical protein